MNHSLVLTRNREFLILLSLYHAQRKLLDDALISYPDSFGSDGEELTSRRAAAPAKIKTVLKKCCELQGIGSSSTWKLEIGTKCVFTPTCIN